MLPNPARVLFPHRMSSNCETATYPLRVPPLITTTHKIYCNESPITLEHHILEIVRGNSQRARAILRDNGSSFTVRVALIDTHLLDEPLCVDIGYLCDRLSSWRLNEWLHFDGTVWPIVEEHGANERHDTPGVISVTLQRSVHAE